MRTATLFSSLLALLPVALASSNGHAARGHGAGHNGVAKRASGAVQVHKRFSDARYSFYDVEVGL